MEPADAPPLESTPVTDLRGVGPGIAAKLAGLGIGTLLDLLFHLPLRYEDRTRVHAIGDASAGDAVYVCGRIEGANVRFGRRRSLVVAVEDDTGAVAIRLFHFNENQRLQLRPGRRIACFGEVRRAAGGIEMVHPEYRLLDDDAMVPTSDRLTPVYPAAAGLGQTLLRRLIDQALDRLERNPDVTELLPAGVAARHRLVTLANALRTIHPAAGGKEPRGGLCIPSTRPGDGSRSRSCSRTISRCACCGASSTPGMPRRSTAAIRSCAASPTRCRSTSPRPSTG